MNILETVLQAAGGSAVSTIAKNFGINGSQASQVIGQLIPALSRGVQKNTQSTEGCLLYTSPSPRDRTRSRMPSSA